MARILTHAENASARGKGVQIGVGRIAQRRTFCKSCSDVRAVVCTLCTCDNTSVCRSAS
jgi:hypothetical protein